MLPILKIFPIFFDLHHAHVRKVIKLSLLFSTANSESWTGPCNRMRSTLLLVITSTSIDNSVKVTTTENSFHLMTKENSEVHKVCSCILKINTSTSCWCNTSVIELYYIMHTWS